MLLIWQRMYITKEETHEPHIFVHRKLDAAFYQIQTKKAIEKIKFLLLLQFLKKVLQLNCKTQLRWLRN